MSTQTRLRHAFALLALLIVASIITPTRSEAATAPTGARYFKETGHNIVARVKSFYEANGDVVVFGLPLTEVIVENGLQVQYFERVRFELHPELSTDSFILLTQLGRNLVRGRADGPFAPVSSKTMPTSAFFRETGHTLSGAFLPFWQKNGALPVFGFPLSQEFQEVSPTDGKAYTVQYFERARFELHPDSPKALVQLSLLGRQALDASAVPQGARAVQPQVTVLGTATTGYNGSFAERVSNIANGAQRMNGQVVQPSQTFSFGTALGAATEEDGFVDGYAIVGGKLQKVTGGGLCQVSTTMYRSVFYAGLQIVSRTPHTYMINFYENIKGFDATVFTPSVDFRWRNDTNAPVYVAASSNPQAATVTFTLYGYNDGRKVKMVGPVETNIVKQGKPNWQFDSSLKKGQVKQLVHGRPGSDIAMQRIVTGANGSTVRKDNLPSKYRPWEDYYLYGPGVTPPAGINIIPGDAKPTETTHP